MNVDQVMEKLHWLGHDSFRLDGPPVVYFDPLELEGQLPTADLILISHEHYDHCSPDDVAKIRGPNTQVLTSASAAEMIPGAQAIHPGDEVTVAGIKVQAVPAYNIDKFRSPGVPFHPKDAKHVGYVVTFDGTRIYFAGDTDHIPEMGDIECDIALLPVSGTYVMTAEEAADAARTLNPQVVVPMHYGAGIGTPEDGSRFTELYDGRVMVMKSA